VAVSTPATTTRKQPPPPPNKKPLSLPSLSPQRVARRQAAAASAAGAAGGREGGTGGGVVSLTFRAGECGARPRARPRGGLPPPGAPPHAVACNGRRPETGRGGGWGRGERRAGGGRGQKGTTRGGGGAGGRRLLPPPLPLSPPVSPGHPFGRASAAVVSGALHGGGKGALWRWGVYGAAAGGRTIRPGRGKKKTLRAPGQTVCCFGGPPRSLGCAHARARGRGGGRGAQAALPPAGKKEERARE
jgi:hypothetical protein